MDFFFRIKIKIRKKNGKLMQKKTHPTGKNKRCFSVKKETGERTKNVSD